MGPSGNLSTAGDSRQAVELQNHTHQYRRKIPDFWKSNFTATPTALHPTVILPPTNLRAPMVILTREALPDLKRISLFDEGELCDIVLQRGVPFGVKDGQLKILHLYTTGVCRAMLNKAFICPIADMAYFIAPLAPSWRNPSVFNHETVEDHILWDVMKAITDSNFAAIPLLPTNSKVPFDEYVKDTIIQDRAYEFTNRCFVTAVRPDLTPLSKANDDSPRQAIHQNFLDYYRFRYGEPSMELKNDEQPMLQVSPVPTVANLLSPESKPLTQSTESVHLGRAFTKYRIPELSFRFPIPASTFLTAFLVPSIIRRMDDLLLVQELNVKLFKTLINENHLLVALTTPAACVGFDYERLELLGDAVLKYICSVYCFHILPSGQEGALDAARQKIITNRNLFDAALHIGLPPYIMGKPFVARLWQPSNPHLDVSTSPANGGYVSSVNVNAQLKISLDTSQSGAMHTGGPGKRSRQRDEQYVQPLGDKTVADVVEAIIGAAFLTGGQDVALKTMTALGPLGLVDIKQWSDLERFKPTYTLFEHHRQLSDDTVRAIENTVGCKFSRSHLLLQALTHASCGEYNYQRLEFLGDAILDFLTVRYIFDGNPQLSPGAITVMKAKMVSNDTLAALCVHLRIHKHIQHSQVELQEAIMAYSSRIHDLQKIEYERAAGEQRSPGRYWSGVVPPKVLSDVVEAIIGALYVSENFSIQTAEALFDTVFRPFFSHHISLQN